jgi:thiamine-monophosphate kinase
MLRVWGDVSVGTGDDAAVLDVPAGSRLVVTTDTAIEGVHFRREWITGAEIGYRSAAAALSDLAAMAADPLGMLLALSLPEGLTPSIEDLAAGVKEAAHRSGCPILGGDTNRAPVLSLTITALGHARLPVRRSGARPGDTLYVTGKLGGPGAALRAWLSGSQPRPDHRARFVYPVARLDEAKWLVEHGARAMIDVSDGLSSDLHHLAIASGAGIVVNLDTVPTALDVSPLQAAESGEEYELVIAAVTQIDCDEFVRRFGIPLTAIGRVEAEGPGTVKFEASGTRVDPVRGYDHFSR